MAGGNLDRRNLEVEQGRSEVAREPELGETGAGLLCQVVRHLDVDVVGQNGTFTRPALVYDLNQLLGDIQAPLVIPAVLEPTGQLRTGIVVHYINVQLALMR